MNLIFEPADLEQASPATVSRCGMIYIEPRLLGWVAFKDSYLVKLEKILLAEQMELLIEMIEWLIPPAFDFLRHHCKLFVEVSDIHQFYVTLRKIFKFSHVNLFFSVIYTLVNLHVDGRTASQHRVAAERFRVLFSLGSRIDVNCRWKNEF